MNELHGLVADFLGSEPPTHVMKFTLENGAEQLAEHFACVERFDFDDELVVTEAEPLIGHIMSGFNGNQLIRRERVSELRQVVSGQIARDGAIRITKSTGLFVAQKH